MKKPNNADRLRHILEAVERIESHLDGYDKQTFEADAKTQDAVVRQMEIIGEAATNLTRDLRSKNPQVEWQIATAMRNRLIHGYFDVDAEIVWNTAQNDLPILKTEVEKILENLT
ncbi:MAG: DUF86 domain-containing protein [Acidobacteria bacterium]|jgi:uncharacterized protein with HEPN domain|nr:DUF86 domain-containing protein [Acidobacteriota bacterium]